MPNKFKEIETELEKTIKKFGTNTEAIFNLGVKMGRELEKTNAPDYRPSIFINIEDKEKITEEARDIKRKIEKLLLSRLHLAITEIINTNYDWTVGVDQYHSGDGKFSDEIIKKYELKFDSIHQQNGNGHFDTYFSVKGKLLKCFDEYGCTPRLEVTLDNDSGDDYVTLTDEEDISSLYGPILQMPIPSTQEELDKLIKLKHSLEKVLMFNIIGGT